METQVPRPRLRNPIACEYCKLKKARCNPSEVEGKCQKCLKSGQTCVPAARNPRPRKAKISKTAGRVAELEKKLDGLLGSVDVSSSVPSEKESHYQTKSPPVAEDEDRTGILLDIHSQIFPGGNRPEEESDGDDIETSQSSSPWMNTSAPTPNSSMGISNSSQITAISFPDSKECEKLLSLFLEMSAYFPFILLPEDTDLKLLLEEKHFLSLAMMAAASSTSAKLQIAMDMQFRQALSTKVIMGGQKSLEIIQGLLVYLAWYPYHLKPRNAQTFQFLQILISMCIDLGLDQPSQDFEVAAELRRAYLGCYYLSTHYSTLFKKPNNMPYTPYTQTCCTFFTTTPENPTDPLLPCLIDLAHSSSSFAQSPLNSTIQIEPLKAFIQTSIPLSPKTTELVTLTQNFTSVFQHTILGPGGFNRSVTQHIPLPIRHESLLPCLHSSITFLDTILSLPIKSYLSFTIIQWSQLVWTIGTLMTISFPIKGIDIEQWNGEQARKEGRLGVYLESLCYRMRVLGGKGRRKEMNHFGLMGVVLEYVRGSFEGMVERLGKTSVRMDGEVAALSSNSNKQSDGNTAPKSGTSTRGPTKCPMLNGGMRTFAAETNAPSDWSSMPNAGELGPGSQDFDLDLGEWGPSLDDFSMWDIPPDLGMDWNLGNQGAPDGGL